MRIAFVGAVEFSRHCLEQVLLNGGQVVGVYTLPAELGHRHSDYADLSPLAAEHALNLHRIRNINRPETLESLRALQPEVIFVFGWSQLLTREVLELAPLGCIGSHPALLPKNRGRHPLIWALVEGLRESGLTFLYLDEGVDSGDLLWQKPFSIGVEDDAGTLYGKIKDLASEAIAEFLPLLAGGTAPRIPQDHSQATYWRQRSGEDGKIDWGSATITTYNLIRALTRPYVGAHTHWEGEQVLVWRSKLPGKPLSTGALRWEPGTIISGSESELQVRTGDGYLTVLEYETRSGQKLPVGARLEERS